MNAFRLWSLGWLVVAGAGGIAACGGGGDSGGSGGNGTGGFNTGTSSMSGGNGNTTGSKGGDGSMSGTFVGSGGGKSTGQGGNNGQDFNVTPTALQTLSVKAGQTMPSATFKSTLDGNPVNAGWSIDRGDVGTITSTSAPDGVFTPNGTVGGLVSLTAGLTVGGDTLQQHRQVLVKITSKQNGPNGTASETGQIATDPTTLTQGGGIGGVGGEGLGTAVSDAPTLAALGSPADDGSALKLKYLYPYDKTVWPRGLLAPLIMWDWMTGDADAIQIHLHTKSGSYDWTGSFAKPAILTQTAGKFIRMPIPEDVWDQATNSAGGATTDGSIDTLTMDLVVAQGGVAHGPVSETWTIANGRLSGIIYYNSYGTQLAQNLGGAKGGNGMFGGAVLSIHVGDTGPKLVAGGTGDTSQCRVCHSVAANGSRLIAQWGDNGDVPSSDYELTPAGATEMLLTNSTTFPGIYPDGSMELSTDGTLYPLPNNATALATPAASGLSAVAATVGMPSFSPDGKLVALAPMAGTNQQIVVLQFDSMAFTFTNPVVVSDDSTLMPAQPQTRPGWPAFLPDGKSLVFHHQSAAGADGNTLSSLNTRKGAKSQIAWTNTTDATHVTTLNALNGLDGGGTSYLPQLAAPVVLATNVGGTCNPGANCCTGDGVVVDNINPAHDDDVDLNYEPTVNPVASGGYAWVVFTSRRMYGTVADIPPFCSDPRGVDLIQNITPKKLWVAAIDLSAPAGSDSSHPAFYLPAQELLAGNSRGFWVLDPCKMDGQTCETGDQCCNGFCEPNGPGGALECSNMSNNGMCSGTNEKCTKTSDCCDSNNVCIGGFCTQKGVQ